MQIFSLHAVRAALGRRGQLAITVGPAAFTNHTHSQVALAQFLQLAEVLRADAVLLVQLLPPRPARTGSRLPDDGDWVGRAATQLVFLRVRCVGSRLPVLPRIGALQYHPLPWEEIQIQEGSL